MRTLSVAPDILSYWIALAIDVFVPVPKLPECRAFFRRQQDTLPLPVYYLQFFVEVFAAD
jgi:hypothetical protein